MGDDLSERWQALIDAIRDECIANEQDPGVLESDVGQLKVSLPFSGGERAAKQFTRRELFERDPRRLALQFYQAYLKDGHAAT